MTEYSYIKKATLAGGTSHQQRKPAKISGNDRDRGVSRVSANGEQRPAEDVAPVRHGKLVEITLDEDLCNNGFCSECGGKNTAIAKYCNWCGAKMDGGGDGEN